MTCFWNGILAALDVQSINNTFGTKSKTKPNPRQFAQQLKNKNTKTTYVKWNGKPLTDKELEENFEAIKCYNISTIGRGYDCSCCDPFLLLVSQLFKVNISHRFNNANIRYTFKDTKKTLNFASNRGHFWHTRR